MKIRPDIFLAATNTLYAALISNLLLIIGCAPLVIGLLITDPARSWPLLALAAPLGAPAFVGVFAVMVSLSGPGIWKPDKEGRSRPITPVATYARAWRTSLRRATTLGAMAMLLLVVLGVDIAWAWGKTIGAAAIPVLVTCMVLVVAVTVLSLVALAERPAARLRDILRPALYLAVRKWHFTILSLGVLVMLLRIIAEKPAIGLGFLAFPLLYLVWSGSRYSLRSILDSPSSTGQAMGSPLSASAARSVPVGSLA
jgi:uncharacterized membrane protein YesL